MLVSGFERYKLVLFLTRPRPNDLTRFFFGEFDASASGCRAFKCLSRSPRWRKALLHSGQLCGFSPLWIRCWKLKFWNIFWGFKVFVTHHMIFQSIGAVKAFATFFTAVASFSAVDQTVLVINWARQETFAANCAQKWSANFIRKFKNFKIINSTYLSPVWHFRMWSFKSGRIVNFRSQPLTVHAKGFTPWWKRRCCQRWDDCV